MIVHVGKRNIRDQLCSKRNRINGGISAESVGQTELMTFDIAACGLAGGTVLAKSPRRTPVTHLRCGVERIASYAVLGVLLGPLAHLAQLLRWGRARKRAGHKGKEESTDLGVRPTSG